MCSGVGVIAGREVCKCIYLLMDSSSDESIKKKKNKEKCIALKNPHVSPLPQSVKPVVL